MNLLELLKCSIGNVLQTIYCQNDEWNFYVLSFIWYHPVLQELLFLMVIANLICISSEKICELKTLNSEQISATGAKTWQISANSPYA